MLLAVFTTDEWLTIVTIAAIALGPIAALEIQKRLEQHRATLDRKLFIFRRLMTTRATQMSPAHVEALNSIEVEFYTAKSGPDKKVLDAWRLYNNHLSSPAGEGDALARWVEKKSGLLIDLLYEMGQRLGYDIDRVTIQKNVYHPQGHVEIELEQHELRKAALAFLSGERPVQTTVVGRVQVTGELPPPEEAVVPALPRPVLPALKAGEERPE
jgi:hypothetical protein